NSTKRMEENGAQTVLVMRASAASIRAKNSQDNILGEALKSMGCINIADDNETLLENLSLESILLANPDKIFIVQSGDDEEGMKANVEATFEENPLWHELDAVKNEDVYYMDKHLFNLKPNARWGEAYEQLEGILFSE
ncbi:MAG: ABC transporter substrate-binding protein, partial [Ruminococcus sp.]|nr:ABC transporter substrate-binding protein [Ruminococcus sp.]